MAFTLGYFYSDEVPDSKRIAQLIESSPYSQIITNVSVDNPTARNALLFGKYPQATVPFASVQNGDQFTSYQPNQFSKFFALADKLLKRLPSGADCVGGNSSDDSIAIAGMRAVSDISRVSREDTDDEREIPSILA